MAPTKPITIDPTGDDKPAKVNLKTPFKSKASGTSSGRTRIKKGKKPTPSKTPSKTKSNKKLPLKPYIAIENRARMIQLAQQQTGRHFAIVVSELNHEPRFSGNLVCLSFDPGHNQFAWSITDLNIINTSDSTTNSGTFYNEIRNHVTHLGRFYQCSDGLHPEDQPRVIVGSAAAGKFLRKWYQDGQVPDEANMPYDDVAGWIVRPFDGYSG